MTIELHTPHEGVQDQIVQHLKQSMIKLSQRHKTISRIEVILREDSVTDLAENKICEIRLTIYGDSLFTHSRTNDYLASAQEALNHVEEQALLLEQRNKDLPDQITSTVKV